MITESSTDIVEGVGMYLFAIYHVVIIIVLVNMLIAMMSHSFEAIQVSQKSDYFKNNLCDGVLISYGLKKIRITFIFCWYNVCVAIWNSTDR